MVAMVIFFVSYLDYHGLGESEPQGLSFHRTLIVLVYSI